MWLPVTPFPFRGLRCVPAMSTARARLELRATRTQRFRSSHSDQHELKTVVLPRSVHKPFCTQVVPIHAQAPQKRTQNEKKKKPTQNHSALTWRQYMHVIFRNVHKITKRTQYLKTYTKPFCTQMVPIQSKVTFLLLKVE